MEADSLGSPDFVQDTGLRLGRALERRKAGRPLKDAVDEVGTSHFYDKRE
jgi:hypothetical protein